MDSTPRPPLRPRVHPVPTLHRGRLLSRLPVPPLVLRPRLLPLPTIVRRHASSGALKMACPHCGACESGVVRSRGAILLDQVHRRRQCICGERFPTFEQVDWDAFKREHPELAAEFPPSWDAINAALHRAWGHAITHDYVREDWAVLQRLLNAMQQFDPRAPHLR